MRWPENQRTYFFLTFPQKKSTENEEKSQKARNWTTMQRNCKDKINLTKKNEFSTREIIKQFFSKVKTQKTTTTEKTSDFEWPSERASDLRTKLSYNLMQISNMLECQLWVVSSRRGKFESIFKLRTAKVRLAVFSIKCWSFYATFPPSFWRDRGSNPYPKAISWSWPLPSPQD